MIRVNLQHYLEDVSDDRYLRQAGVTDTQGGVVVRKMMCETTRQPK